MPIDRRTFLRTTGIGAGAVLLSSGPGSVAAAAVRHRLPGYAPTGTLEVWVHESPPTNELLTTLIAEYQGTYPDVSINLLPIPYADFETKALTSTAANDGPDLVKLPSWSLADWADKGLLVPLDAAVLGMDDDAAIVAAFAEGVLGGVSFEEQLYALPVDYQNLMLFYNKTHFEEAGLDPDAPPATWEDIVAIGGELTRRSGDTVERAGFEWWYTTPIWVYLEVESLAAQLGGSVLNEDGTESALGSDAGRQAIDYYVGMSAEHHVSSFELVTVSVLDTIADGTSSMFVSGSFSGPSLSARTDGALSLEAGTLGVAPMPTWADAVNDVTTAYSWGWGVTNNAADPALAGHFARFLTEPAQADRFYADAGVATPYAGFAESEATSANAGNALLVEQVPTSVYLAQTPNFAGVMAELTTQIQAAATGQKSAEQAVDDFDGAMRRVLR